MIQMRHKFFSCFQSKLYIPFLSLIIKTMTPPRPRSNSQSSEKMKNSTKVTKGSNLGKPIIYLQYTCYICGNAMSSAKQTINHIKNIHGYEVPSRAVGRRRPQDNDYEYIRDKISERDALHYACSSCWFHCPEDNLEVLNKHTNDEHNPLKVDITKDDDLTSTRPIRMRSNNVSRSNHSDSLSDVDQINQKLDELINLFNKAFN